MSTENIDIYRVSDPGAKSWVTQSDIRWVFATAQTVTDALANLVFEIQELQVEPYVSHLHLEIGEDGVVTVGALYERGYGEQAAL